MDAKSDISLFVYHRDIDTVYFYIDDIVLTASCSKFL
jgi:hypothetical protein